MRNRISITCVFLLALAAPATAQDIKITGQIRPRVEQRSSSADDMWSSMRTRLSLDAKLGTAAHAFAQFQDVRMWGEEVSTTSGLNHVDLHQGFVLLGSDTTSISAKLGRQEISLGEQRLVGSVDWSQSARAFDGLRVHDQFGRIRTDVFGFQLADATIPGRSSDERFFGAQSTIDLGSSGLMEFYLLHNHADAASQTRQTTLGTRAVVNKLIRIRLETAAQRGTRAGAGVNAYMIAARATVPYAKHRASTSLWWDELSGDNNPLQGDNRVFDTLFATNHPFYGLADLFTNIPVHTANRGLRDFALKNSFQARQDMLFSLDLHRFSASARDGLQKADFADEADIAINYKYSAKLSLTAGVSGVHVLDGMRELKLLDHNLTYSYLMLNATF